MSKRDPTPKFVWEGAGNERREIALVPISKGATAEIYANDYDRLMDIGVTPYWSLDAHDKEGKNLSVRFNSGDKRDTAQELTGIHGSGATPVAWVILGVLPKHGHTVDYVDGTPTNLRRENLIVRPQQKGKGKGEFPAAVKRRELLAQP